MLPGAGYWVPGAGQPEFNPIANQLTGLVGESADATDAAAENLERSKRIA